MTQSREPRHIEWAMRTILIESLYTENTALGLRKQACLNEQPYDSLWKSGD